MFAKRGEIYWVQFDPVKGSVQGGLRPALVVQQDIGNRYSPTAVVVALATTLPPRLFPFVVVVEPAESGLSQASAIRCAQVATIQKEEPGSRLRPSRGESAVRPIGHLSPRKMLEVDAALRYNLGL